MPPAGRLADFAIAAAIVILAVAISPLGIRFITGRLDLSPRVVALGLTFDAFLLILAGVFIAVGRVRRLFLHLLAWTIPLAALAALEAAAIAAHLADRIAPLEDMSILANKDNWPPQLMSNGRKVEKDGLLLYRPWEGQGVSINQFGLRTALPSPKKPGEWRIAVTGGSVAWGWRLRDADTFPVQLQQNLRRDGHANVTVYNFAEDSITIATELELLKRFRGLYAIDEVVFFTGANDATGSYMGAIEPQDRFAGVLGGATAFELIKVASRLNALVVGPPQSVLAKMDDEILPRLAKQNSLRDGVMAAQEYCGATAIVCDFILQPMLLTRREPRGPEIRLARSFELVYPRYRQLIATVYRSAVDTGAAVQDGSDLLDQSLAPYFFDGAHFNEAGNHLVAERIAAKIGPRLH